MNLYLDAELYERLRAVVDRLPGMSISGLVNESLHGIVPGLEALADAVDSGDKDAAFQVLRLTSADLTEQIGTAMRRFREGAPGKEVSG